MIWIFLLFIIVCFIGATFNFRSGFKDYLGKVQTNAIRGIFAVIIFFSHFNSYVSIGEEVGDSIYLKIFSFIGQLMVAPFFFYSGYGIYCSAKKKPNYIKAFPRHRLLKTFLFFTLAVIPYLAIALIQKTQYSVPHIIFAFTGWTSLGNSNWFMFVILSLYLITYLSAKLTKNTIDLRTIGIILALSLIYVFALSFLKHGQTWWINTIMSYIGGLLYGYYENNINKALGKHYLAVLLAVLFSFIAAYFMQKISIFTIHIGAYNILSILFCVLISIFTYKIKINNHLLRFCGFYSFEIYILQRIPDILLQPYLQKQTIPFFFISLAITIILSMLYKLLSRKIDKAILKS